MIYLEEHHAKIVREILIKYPYTFCVFGSRSKGVHKRLSDLDLCFFDSIPFSTQAQIDEDFEEENRCKIAYDRHDTPLLLMFEEEDWFWFKAKWS